MLQRKFVINGVENISSSTADSIAFSASKNKRVKWLKKWEKCERRILTAVNYFKWMLVRFFMEEKFVKRQNNMEKTIEINFQEDIQEIIIRQEPAFISSGWSMKLFPCVSYSSNYALISLDTTGLHAHRCYIFVVPFPFLLLATVITSYSSIHNSLPLSEVGMLSDPRTHCYRNKLFFVYLFFSTCASAV